MSVSNSVLKRCVGFACLAAMLTGISTGPVSGQTEYWDTEARKRSQNLSSSALNHLKNIYAGKKKRSGHQSDLKEAIQLLERAIVQDPTDPLPHYLLGIALSIDGRYEKALPMLQKANKLDPDEFEILLATGLAQYLSGNYDRAISIFQRLAPKMKRQAPVHVCIGYAQMRAGKLEDAIENFSRAQELEPGLQSAQEGMTRVYYLAGDLDQSLKTAAHAQSIREYPPVSLIQADIYRLKGDTANCLNTLKSWKKATRKYGPHKSMTEIGFSKQHDFQWDPFCVDDADSDATIKARLYLIDKPKKCSGLARRGNAEKVIARLDRRLNESSNDFYLYHGKGVLSASLYNLKQAAEQLNLSLKICPGNRLDLLNLALVHLASGENDRAKAMIDKFRSVYPDTGLAAPLNQPTSESVKEKAEKPTSSSLSPGTGTKKQSKPEKDDPF